MTLVIATNAFTGLHVHFSFRFRVFVQCYTDHGMTKRFALHCPISTCCTTNIAKSNWCLICFVHAFVCVYKYYLYEKVEKNLQEDRQIHNSLNSLDLYQKPRPKRCSLIQCLA